MTLHTHLSRRCQQPAMRQQMPLLKNLFLLLLLLSVTGLAGQELTIQDILARSDAKTRSLKAFSYWIDFEMKYLTDEDTTRKRGICYLKPAPEDSMKAHHYVIDLDELGQQVYDGENILNVNLQDSSSLMVNTGMHGYSFITNGRFEPLIRYHLLRDSFFLKKLADPAIVETAWREDDFRGQPCYAVYFKYEDGKEVSDFEFTYYLRRTDYFPIGFRESMKFHNMVQYRSYLLSNIAEAERFDDQLFDLDYHIPIPSKVVHFAPRERPPLLSEGQDAPDIEKLAVGGEGFSLKGLRGKVVLLDFWYRSCYPCLKALPDLQRIADTFDPSQVEVVGLNIIDTPEQIIPFLAERGITYSNVHDARDTAEAYQVSGYPTLYIVDPAGKISHAHIGWSEGFYEAVSEQLGKLLR